jgi:hypothetical protein
MLAIPFLTCNYTLKSVPLWGPDWGGGMGAFSSPDALAMRSIVSMVNVLKMHNSGCNSVNNILCHCKKTLPIVTWIDINMNPTDTLT